MTTFTWLGAIRIPAQLVEFWSDMLVMRVAGMPVSSVVYDAVRCLDGPITSPEATPSATPALSPFVSGTVVAILCAGVPINKILYDAGTPIGPAAMFG